MYVLAFLYKVYFGITRMGYGIYELPPCSTNFVNILGILNLSVSWAVIYAQSGARNAKHPNETTTSKTRSLWFASGSEKTVSRIASKSTASNGRMKSTVDEGSSWKEENAYSSNSERNLGSTPPTKSRHGSTVGNTKRADGSVSSPIRKKTAVSFALSPSGSFSTIGGGGGADRGKGKGTSTEEDTYL